MSDYSQLAVVDVETTGLDPNQHQVWEVALKLPDRQAHDQDLRWLLPVDLGRADPYALELGHFYDRYTGPTCTMWDFAKAFEALTRGRHLVGNVVSFDEERLRRILKSNGACPGWHYHLVEVEALVAGKLGIPPPWKSPELSAAIGVEVPSEEEKHSAVRDVRWAWEMYLAVMDRQVVEPLSPKEIAASRNWAQNNLSDSLPDRSNGARLLNRAVDVATGRLA